MARPIKKGLDYFPLNTDFMNNRTIRRLKRKGGFKAIVLYMDLLCDIYANSYFIEITDNYIFDLSDQLGLEEKDIRSMIEIMIELGLFHERSFDKSHILTSETIQEQYAFSKSKRPDNKAVIELYKIVNDVKTEVFADETPQNDTKSAYSIVKERKENITTTSSPARTYAREEILRSYRDELSNDEDWRAAIVRMSGKGPAGRDGTFRESHRLYRRHGNAPHQERLRPSFHLLVEMPRLPTRGRHNQSSRTNRPGRKQTARRPLTHRRSHESERTSGTNSIEHLTSRRT